MPRRDEAEVTEEFARWELNNEDYENLPPAAWWEEELSLVPDEVAARLSGSLDRLADLGCLRGEMFQQLRAISGLATLTQIPRRDIVAYRDAVAKIAKRLDTFAMTQLGPALSDLGPLNRELAAHLHQLDSFLQRSETFAHPYLRAAEEEFNRYVHHHAAGAQHADVALLLQFVTRQRKTQGAQRMATSRANRVKAMTTKKVKVKPVQKRADRGWEEFRKREMLAKSRRRKVRDMTGYRVGKRP